MLYYFRFNVCRMLHSDSVLINKGCLGGRIKALLYVSVHVVPMPCNAVLIGGRLYRCPVMRCISDALVSRCSGVLVDGCSMCSICACALLCLTIVIALMRWYCFVVCSSPARAGKELLFNLQKVLGRVGEADGGARSLDREFCLGFSITPHDVFYGIQ